MLQRPINTKGLLSLLLVILLLTGCDENLSVFQGYIEGRYSYLASAVAGRLNELAVARGAAVKTNQVLYALDAEPEQAKLQQAIKQNQADILQLENLKTAQRSTIIAGITAQREQAIANMKLAEKNYQRYQQLLTKHAIDKATFDAAQANYDAAVQRVAEVKANLAEAKQGSRAQLIAAQEAVVAASTAVVKQAEWAVGQKVVRAPRDGTIVNTFYLVGEFIPAGQPVISFLAPQDITLIFYVSPKVLPQIKHGAKIMFKCDGSSERYQATISFIASEAEYTPPVIFSKDTRDKLVFRIEAVPVFKAGVQFHPGQPIDVYVPKT